MKDRIIDILQNSDKALTAYELEGMLNLISAEEVKDMLEALRSLEKDAIIYHSNKDKYLMLKDSHLNRGVMRANKKGFGFVDIDDNDEDVYIKEENMNGAIHGDIVLVEITSKKNMPRLEGRVMRILQRESDKFIGEINFKKDTGYITLDDSKIKLKIQIY